MKLSLIAAVARNGVIGNGNRLPWYLPEDLAHFRRVTAGCTVIMGRRTWDSLPERFRPLPGRRNIVVTQQPGWAEPGAEVAASPDAALALLGGDEKAFVIGGVALYAALMPQVDELLLTEIASDFAGDTRLPDFDRSAFEEVARQVQHAAAPNQFDFAFVTYRRQR